MPGQNEPMKVNVTLEQKKMLESMNPEEQQKFLREIIAIFYSILIYKICKTPYVVHTVIYIIIRYCT